MKLFLKLLPVLLVLISACSGEPIQVQEDEVVGEIDQNRLTVFNSSDQNIYYALFDQSILPSILWAPISTDENKIPGFHKRSFEITDILRNGTTTGTIVFFFWVERDPEGGDMKFVTFDVGGQQ